MPRAALGKRAAQPNADLFGTPLALQLRLHDRTQIGIRQQPTALPATGTLGGASVSQVCVVAAAIVTEGVSTQLTTDRGRCPPRRRPISRRDKPFTRRIAIRCRSSRLRYRSDRTSSGDPCRWQAALLVPPTVSGLASDPDPAAHLDRTHSSQDQLPVLCLQRRPTLRSTPASHSHTCLLPVVLRQAVEPKRNQSGSVFEAPIARRQPVDSPSQAGTTRQRPYRVCVSSGPGIDSASPRRDPHAQVSARFETQCAQVTTRKLGAGRENTPGDKPLSGEFDDLGRPYGPSSREKTGRTTRSRNHPISKSARRSSAQPCKTTRLQSIAAASHGQH